MNAPLMVYQKNSHIDLFIEALVYVDINNIFKLAHTTTIESSKIVGIITKLSNTDFFELTTAECNLTYKNILSTDWFTDKDITKFKYGNNGDKLWLSDTPGRFQNNKSENSIKIGCVITGGFHFKITQPPDVITILENIRNTQTMIYENALTANNIIANNVKRPITTIKSKIFNNLQLSTHNNFSTKIENKIILNKIKTIKFETPNETLTTPFNQDMVQTVSKDVLKLIATQKLNGDYITVYQKDSYKQFEIGDLLQYDVMNNAYSLATTKVHGIITHIDKNNFFNLTFTNTNLYYRKPLTPKWFDFIDNIYICKYGNIGSTLWLNDKIPGKLQSTISENNIKIGTVIKNGIEYLKQPDLPIIPKYDIKFEENRPRNKDKPYKFDITIPDTQYYLEYENLNKLFDFSFFDSYHNINRHKNFIIGSDLYYGYFYPTLLFKNMRKITTIFKNYTIHIEVYFNIFNKKIYLINDNHIFNKKMSKIVPPIYHNDELYDPGMYTLFTKLTLSHSDNSNNIEYLYKSTLEII